ncbi:MAG: flippase [Dorea sp.]|nr:flippase [Dorea sp.]
MKIHSVKFNFIMNFIMTASSVLFPIITFPYISRVLLSEGNGKVAFASSVITYFNMFASLGIPTYGIRACAKVRDDRERLSKTVQELLIINSGTMLITCAVFAASLLFVPKFAEEKELLLINGIGMVLNMFAINWLFNALEQYAYITVCNLAVKIVSLGLMFALVREADDYIIYGAITMIASSASYIFNFIYARRFITFKKQGEYKFLVHIKPILIFFATSAAINVYTNLDVIMLGFMKGDREVGYYNAAIKVKTILVTLITSLGTVLLPRLSYYVKKGEEKAFYNMVGKAVNFVVLIGVPLTLYFGIFAKESILFLAGNDFLGATAPMIILMPTLLLIGLSNITGIQILTPQNKEQQVLYSILCGAGIDFLLNLVLIPRYSSSGAAFATVMAELFVLIVQCLYLKDILQKVTVYVSLKKILAAAALASGAGVMVKILMEMHVFFQLVISAFVYFGFYGGVLVITREKMIWEVLDMIILKKIRVSGRKKQEEMEK